MNRRTHLWIRSGVHRWGTLHVLRTHLKRKTQKIWLMGRKKNGKGIENLVKIFGGFSYIWEMGPMMMLLRFVGIRVLMGRLQICRLLFYYCLCLIWIAEERAVYMVTRNFGTTTWFSNSNVTGEEGKGFGACLDATRSPLFLNLNQGLVHLAHIPIFPTALKGVCITICLINFHKLFLKINKILWIHSSICTFLYPKKTLCARSIYKFLLCQKKIK